MTYQWEKNGQIIPGETTPRLAKTYFVRNDQIRLTVKSANGESGSVTAVIGNSPPFVTSVPFMPEYISRGIDINVAPVATDADNDEVKFSYRWQLNGTDLNDDAPLLKGDRFKRGDRIGLQVIPSDSYDQGKPFIAKELVIPNGQPVFVSTPPQEFKSNRYVYASVAQDPDGDPVTYELTTAPRGMTIDSRSGRIEWQIGSGDSGSHTIEIVARDSLGSWGSQRYTLAITIP